MNKLDRQAALDAARGGDPEALGQLLDSYRPYLRAISRAFRDKRLQARLDDSDLVQDALLEAHRAFGRFAGASLAEFVAWLRQVVIRSAGHTMRGLAAGRRTIDREQSLENLNAQADSSSSPSAKAMRHEEAVLIAEAIDRLPDDMQQVVLARLVDGLSHAEIAERLGREDGAVRVLFSRAMRRLRADLQVPETRIHE